MFFETASRRTQMLRVRRRVRAATERAQFKAAVVSPVDKTGPAANRATDSGRQTTNVWSSQIEEVIHNAISMLRTDTQRDVQKLIKKKSKELVHFFGSVATLKKNNVLTPRS